MQDRNRNTIIRTIQSGLSPVPNGPAVYSSWSELRERFDYTVSFDYFIRVTEGDWPDDAFSAGQMASKLWLASNLRKYLDDRDVVVIQACWFGQFAPLIADRVHRVYGFDSDPHAIQLSEEFCQPEIQDNWKFKGVVADINLIDWGDVEIDIDGELVEIKPDIIINTSTEHMTSEWYDTVSPGTFLALQGNSDHTLDGHINAANTYEEWSEQFPMDVVCDWGAITFPTYTRYMKIGRK